MTLPEDPSTQEEPSQPEKDFVSDKTALPEGFTALGEPMSLPPARRRRRSRRYFVTPGEDERSAVLERLARRAFPSFEFFLFSLLCGAILGAGFILDSQALLLLGILLAPLMTPWVGMVLGTVTGSWRFFLQTFVAMVTAWLLIFLTGGLAGLAARFWPHLALFQANIQSHLWWPNFIVLVLGAALLAYSFVHSEDKPILPSVMLSYELLLPISAAGFGLGSGTAHIWPDGFLVFLVHLALAILVGGIVLLVLRFKPRNALGGVLTVLVGLGCLAALAVFTGLADLVLGNGPAPAAGTPTATAPALTTPTNGPLETATASAPPVTPTPGISPTSVFTPTLEPTRSYAVIAASVGGGALVRAQPGVGAQVTILMNGYMVEVLPQVQNVGGYNWTRIRTADGTEGWVLQSVLQAATPSPSPTPGLTPTH